MSGSLSLDCGHCCPSAGLAVNAAKKSGKTKTLETLIILNYKSSLHGLLPGYRQSGDYPEMPVDAHFRQLCLLHQTCPAAAARAARWAANSCGVGMGSRLRPANISAKRPISSAWISPLE